MLGASNSISEVWRIYSFDKKKKYSKSNVFFLFYFDVDWIYWQTIIQYILSSTHDVIASCSSQFTIPQRQFLLRDNNFIYSKDNFVSFSTVSRIRFRWNEFISFFSGYNKLYQIFFSDKQVDLFESREWSRCRGSIREPLTPHRFVVT